MIFRSSTVRATKAQVNHIEILAGDLGLSIRARDHLIAEIVDRACKPDALTVSEASQVIDKFKEIKRT